MNMPNKIWFFAFPGADNIIPIAVSKEMKKV